MKMLAVIVALVAVSWGLAQLGPLIPAGTLENNESVVKLVGSAIFALPIIGLVLAIRSFSRWHRGFHARVRDKGLW